MGVSSVLRKTKQRLLHATSILAISSVSMADGMIGARGRIVQQHVVKDSSRGAEMSRKTQIHVVSQLLG
jgi:hypothetical protein